MIGNLPVLGVCGFSGSGKTTLIESLLSRLASRGLRAAVAKHDAHVLDVDRKGKDSDRFFRAGADVLLAGPGEDIRRAHRRAEESILGDVAELAQRCDVVLVEGRKHTPIRKIWLLSEGEAAPPESVTDILAVLPRDADRLGIAGPILDDLIDRCLESTPVFGAVLLGPDEPEKAAACSACGPLPVDFAKTLDALARTCAKVALVRAGGFPEEVPQSVIRLPAAAGVPWPLGCALSAMRWAPYSSWVLTACAPGLDEAYCRMLTNRRVPGEWAILSGDGSSGGTIPSTGLFDFRCRPLLERFAIEGINDLSAVSRFARTARVFQPLP